MRVSVSVRSMAAIVTMCASFACGGNATTPPAASSTPAASPASTSAGAEFGVAECDDYMKKYLACVDKLAPAAQAQARQSLEQSRSAWKTAAVTAVGRAALATTCKAASDSAAPMLRAQGCTW